MDASGIETVALRTPTLPPATHTNTYLVGQTSLSVFDPASPYEDEQQVLYKQLNARKETPVERIVLTHHHHDHVLGAMDLQAHLADQGLRVPILAHPITADLLKGTVTIDSFWTDGETLDCGGVAMTATHTPGHAAGHLVFQSSVDGAMIAGDMVAGVGTILIEPMGGNLEEYLASLEKMKELNPSVLLPAHGPALPHTEQILSMYIAHRHLRTDQIRQGLDEKGRQTPKSLVAFVYPDLDPRAHGIAAMQIHSHLIWMDTHGLTKGHNDGTWSLLSA